MIIAFMTSCSSEKDAINSELAKLGITEKNITIFLIENNSCETCFETLVHKYKIGDFKKRMIYFSKNKMKIEPLWNDFPGEISKTQNYKLYNAVCDYVDDYKGPFIIKKEDNEITEINYFR